VGTDECLQRCGLTRPSQPIKQHQPIVSGNAPPGVSVPSTTTAAASKADLAATVKATSTSGADIHSRSVSASPVNNAVQANSAEGSGSGDSGSASPILIALLVINAFFVVGLLFAAFMFIRDRSRRSAFDSHKYANPSAEAMHKYVWFIALTFPPDVDLFFRVERYEPEHGSTYYDPYHPSKSSAEVTK
jgi:hypothetical protein